MLAAGVGASVARKEDDRFLRGRGQYVADFRHPGMRDVAFVRSSVAHARIRAHRTFRRTTRTRCSPPGIWSASSRSGRRPRCAASSIRASRSWRRQGPLCGRDRRRCASAARALRPRISPRWSTVDYDELAAGDRHARGPPRRTRRWFMRTGATTSSSSSSRTARWTRVAATAAIKVTREIRTARHCMLPIEGRGVVAYWDPRLAVSHRDQREPDAACRAARHRRMPGSR